MAIFLAGKAVCYRILAFFCYGKLHFKCESAGLQVIRHTGNREGANPLSALAYANCAGIRGNSIEHLFLSDKLLFGHTRIPACAGMMANGRFRIGDTSESAINE